MYNACTRMSCGSGTAGGYTLVEVLIGMIIFAFGILALTQLQGNLAKSSADSNARTVAVNLAEEIIEEARTFARVTSGGGLHAFNDIVDGNRVETRGGIDYTISENVENYYYVPSATVNGNGTFSTTKPSANIVNPDMKMLTVNVTWGGTGQNAQSFQVDNATRTQGLGTGSITLTDMISSITSPSGGKVLLNKTTNSLYGPPVDYNPGSRPEIISIQLGENRFKESTTPLPDVIRTDELVETTFDVVTYSQSDEGATFLRREEFRAVSCECTLRAPDTDTEGGLRPTIWNGNDYSDGEFVSKPYGESANNQQSAYCDICCRDHHDGGTGENDDGNDEGKALYNPFRPVGEYWGSSALLGDHMHYNRSSSGDLNVAGDGDIYEEACRLVRKDGFFRVAQDLRQEGLNSFPASYLDESAEVTEYSSYVTGSVSLFEAEATNNYEGDPPELTLPGDMATPVVFPASSIANATLMKSVGSSSQQLRARGIYVDYITDELRAIVNCMDAGGLGSSCGAPGANSSLEVLPFYDVQVTWLARWNENPNNIPIEVSNETVQDDNVHSRGLARITGLQGSTQITADLHRGNLGLTATDKVDPQFESDLRNYTLYATANSATTPNATGYTVRGLITSGVNGLKATDAEISVSAGQCDRTTTGFDCVIPTSAINPRITIAKYFKNNKELYACSTVMSINGTNHSGSIPADNWTRFNLPAVQNLVADVVIKEGSCN
jgi:type II secretory pathway pseudopilin PulG